MYTSPSPLPRRAPLRLPFSVHIRKLFFLFSQLRSLHHPPLIPHLSHRRSGHAPRRGWDLSLCLPCRGPVLAPRRGRRPRRPASFFFHAYGGDISRSGATSFCSRRQKDAKTPPKTHGLWNSFTPNVIRRKKAHRESLPLLSPLPLPRTARVACYDRLRYSAIRAAAAPVFRAAMRWFIGFAAACWHAVLQNALRSSAYFFIFRGPTGRTYTCCQRRQVRDLIIAYIGRPTDFPCPPRQRQRG